MTEKCLPTQGLRATDCAPGTSPLTHARSRWTRLGFSVRYWRREVIAVSHMVMDGEGGVVTGIGIARNGRRERDHRFRNPCG